jgi:hypothetical protein
MSHLAHAALLTALGAAGLGAGCATTAPTDAQTPMTVDSVMVAGANDLQEDLVQTGRLELADGAAWATMPLAEWMALAAATPEERQAAESGMYLGDEVRAVRLQPAGELLGQARHETDVPVGTAFETEVLHRFTGASGRLDLTFTGEAATEGRVMPAEMMASFRFDGDGARVVVYLGELDNYPSEVAAADLPSELDVASFAHRYGVRYEPGRVEVLLDGEPVAEAAVRLGGGPMTLAIRAAAGQGADAYLLRWTFDAAE